MYGSHPALLEIIFIVRSHVHRSGGRPTLLGTGLPPLVCIMSPTHCVHFVTMLCTLHHGTIRWKCKTMLRSVRVVQEQADIMIAARQPPFIIILSVSLIHISLKTTTILPLHGIKRKTTPGPKSRKANAMVSPHSTHPLNYLFPIIPNTYRWWQWHVLLLSV